MSQDGIAVEFIRHPYSREKMMIHLQILGNDPGLINTPCPAFAHIHLLQGHDIRMMPTNNPGNAFRRHHPIHAETTMDIV